jgi:hypothetical protein
MSLDINLTGVEKTSNKKTTLTDNSDTFYPTQKAVKTAVDAKFNTPTGTTAQYLRGDGSLDTFPTIPDVTGLQSKAVVVSANQTAVNDGSYTVVANATFTDPSPTEGKGYRVFVRNGTATINSVAYTVGTSIFRVFHSGAWTSYVSLPDSNFVASNSAITGATKTKITYDSKGLVTSGADATTADIADSSNKRYVTDAQLTVIGNTSGTNTGDETQASILSKLGFFVNNRTTDTTAVTGTTTETIIDSVLIPANTYSASGGILRLYNSKFSKTGTAGTLRIKIYVGPNAGNLTGATLLADSGSLASTIVYSEMLRTFTVGSATLKGIGSGVVSLTDVVSSNSARSSIAWNPAIDNYIHYTVINGSSADSTVMIGNSVKNF